MDLKCKELNDSGRFDALRLTIINFRPEKGAKTRNSLAALFPANNMLFLPIIREIVSFGKVGLT